MTNHRRRVIFLFLAALLLLPCLPAVSSASPAPTELQCVCGDHVIGFQREESQWTLFLPAAADLTRLTFLFEDEGLRLRTEEGELDLVSGEPFDLTALFPYGPDHGVYWAELCREDEVFLLKLMRSEHIAALFLTSEDPDRDRSWVDETKSHKAAGSAELLSAGGEVLYSGGLRQIKGRGNSTWLYPKKPYQIKLEKAADLMECGEPSRTWVLLANYIDPSLLRNRISYDLAAELGLDYSPHSRPVDLFYDGEYRGSYLLSEKTEVGESRVQVRDLDAAYEEANPELEDFSSLPLTEGLTEAGTPCQYAADLNDPEDLSGGYLLEMDYEDRAREEASWFSTALDQYLTIKSPEYASKAAVDYISGLWQRLESAAAAGGQDPETGTDCADVTDLTSLARCYLLLELSQDRDAFLSSTYFYKPAGEERLYAGPVWDFDSAYGLSALSLSPTVLTAARSPLAEKLLTVPAIRGAVKEESPALYRLVMEILLSRDPDRRGRAGLRSLRGYDSEIAASRRMDRALWPEAPRSDTPRQDLADFLSRREPWLYNEIAGWPETGTDPVFASAFFDVTGDDWFGEAVEAVSARNLLQGVSQGQFDPYGAMSRAMVCMVLYRMAGEPETDFEQVFSDVSEQAWYADAVCWAYERQVVEGYPDGSFRPDAFVTRQELISLMYRCFTGQVPEEGWDLSAFTDQASVQDWAFSAFGWAVDRGIVSGIPGHDGELFLCPQDPLPRCQCAAMFYRLLLLKEAGQSDAAAEDTGTEPVEPPTPDIE